MLFVDVEVNAMVVMVGAEGDGAFVLRGVLLLFFWLWL